MIQLNAFSCCVYLGLVITALGLPDRDSQLNDAQLKSCRSVPVRATELLSARQLPRRRGLGCGETTTTNHSAWTRRRFTAKESAVVTGAARLVVGRSARNTGHKTSYPVRLKVD